MNDSLDEEEVGEMAIFDSDEEDGAASQEKMKQLREKIKKKK